MSSMQTLRRRLRPWSTPSCPLCQRPLRSRQDTVAILEWTPSPDEAPGRIVDRTVHMGCLSEDATRRRRDVARDMTVAVVLGCLPGAGVLLVAWLDGRLPC
jgi:hypothetical protein